MTTEAQRLANLIPRFNDMCADYDLKISLLEKEKAELKAAAQRKVPHRLATIEELESRIKKLRAKLARPNFYPDYVDYETELKEKTELKALLAARNVIRDCCQTESPKLKAYAERKRKAKVEELESRIAELRTKRARQFKCGQGYYDTKIDLLEQEKAYYV